MFIKIVFWKQAYSILVLKIFNILRTMRNILSVLCLSIIKTFCSIIPIKKGLDRVTRSKIVTWLIPYINTEKTALLNNEISMIVDIKDYDARTLYLFSRVDPHVLDVCQSLLRPGNCFLDIGANYGSIGMLCRNYVGDDGEIHLFEPQPNLCQRIRSAQGLDWSRIHLHEIGLLNRDAVIEMYLSDEQSGKASFVLPSSSRDTLKLKVRNIATYVPNLIGERQFGVKIDVEGAEDMLIPYLIRQKKLKFIVFETVHMQNKTELFCSMIQHGFILFEIVNNMFSTKLQIVREPSLTISYKDIVAVRATPFMTIPDLVDVGYLSRLLDSKNTVSEIKLL